MIDISIQAIKKKMNDRYKHTSNQVQGEVLPDKASRSFL